MSEQQQAQTTQTAAAHATPSSPTAAPQHPATGMVHTMLSRGERAPRAIATIMEAFPAARDEILAFLHGSAGNAFVAEVTATRHDEEPKAADVPLGRVRITANSLRVRSSPSTASKKNVTGRLSRGSVVTVQGKDGDWLRIEHDGQTCFIHGDYCVSVAAPKKAEPKAGGEEDDGDVAQEAAPPVVVAPPPAAPVVEAAQPATAQPAPVPMTPAPTAQPTQTAPKPHAAPVADVDASASLGGSYKGVFDKVYSTGSQVSQVWASAGGLSATPNIYIHFHGHRTDYGIDDDLEWHEGTGGRAPKEHRKKVDKGGSGHRAAEQAMSAAAGQNTIAILPQGVLGEGGKGVHEGGYQKDLATLGLSGFLDKILKQVGKDLGIANLAPGNIALGGHSSGGYTGLNSAMSRLDKGEKDAALMDKITDVTMYDSNYGSGGHLDQTREWAFHEGPSGTPTKNVRLVNGWSQQSAKKKDHSAHDLWFARFGEANLKTFAKAHKMTVRPVGDVGEKLDNETTVMQHTQIVRADGSIQADVLVLQFSRKDGLDHEALRDREIDDAIMSIGDGAEGNKQFGRHDKGKLIEKAAALEAEEKEDGDGDDDILAANPVTADATMPQPKHTESDDREAPEKVEAPPAAKAPPKKAQKAKKRDEEREKLFAELYDHETGRVRAEKLGRSTDVMVKKKGQKKKEKVTINLTDAQYEFKKLCYNIATGKMTGRLFGGVDDGDLSDIPGSSQQIRTAALPDLNNFMSAARAAGHTLRVTSGYRAPEKDMRIWDDAFDSMYLWETQKYRQAKWPDDEYGQAAAEYLVSQVAGRKAPPGKSNHSNGIAVDFTVTVNGNDIPNKYNDQKAWRKSDVYKWLKDNCSTYNFKNLSTEAWHYDWTK